MKGVYLVIDPDESFSLTRKLNVVPIKCKL